MTLKNIHYLITLSAAALCASCADTVRYIAPDDPVDPIVQPSYDEALARWEAALPSASFVEVPEVIPTDTTAADYDDYIENQEFKKGRVVSLTWQGDQVLVDNPQADKGVSVTTRGGYVVIENLESEEGADDARGKVTYRLTGASDRGQLKIYSNKKFLLSLDGVQLHCPDGPAISIQKKKRCFVQCEDGTLNLLSDGVDYASDAEAEPAEDEKGCLFSEGQLIFCGSGQLVIQATHQHGIASDEYIHIHTGCRIDVRQAPKDGIHSKQQFTQTGGLVRSYATKDALQSDSLGIHLTAGYLYLCGERAYSAGAGGKVSIISPARLSDISWGTPITQ